jgi:hypothetical protein
MKGKLNRNRLIPWQSCLYHPSEETIARTNKARQTKCVEELMLLRNLRWSNMKKQERYAKGGQKHDWKYGEGKIHD